MSPSIVSAFCGQDCKQDEDSDSDASIVVLESPSCQPSVAEAWAHSPKQQYSTSEAWSLKNPRSEDGKRRNRCKDRVEVTPLSSFEESEASKPAAHFPSLLSPGRESSREAWGNIQNATSQSHTSQGDVASTISPVQSQPNQEARMHAHLALDSVQWRELLTEQSSDVKAISKEAQAEVKLHLGEVSCKKPRRTSALLTDALRVQLVSSFCFTMGFAWKIATLKLVAREHITWNPDIKDVNGTWIVAGFCVFIFAVWILLLLMCRRSLRQRANVALQAVNTESALKLSKHAVSLEAVVKWGLTFMLAAQLDNALSASVAKYSLIANLAFLAALLLSICTLVVGTHLILCIPSRPTVVESGSCRQSGGQGAAVDASILAGIASAVLRSGAYVMAFGFLSFANRLFTFGSGGKKSDEAESIAGVTVLSAVLLALFAMLAYVASQVWKASSEAEASYGTRAVVGFAVYNLIIKTLTLAAVMSICMLVYVGLGHGLQDEALSVYSELEVGTSFMFLALSLILLVAGILAAQYFGHAICRVEHGWMAKVSQVDSMLLDQQSLTRANLSAMLESLSWLVGLALYVCCIAVFVHNVRSWKSEVGDNVGFYCGLALASSASATVAAACCMPASSARSES